jgi:hypothetical protein
MKSSDKEVTYNIVAIADLEILKTFFNNKLCIGGRFAISKLHHLRCQFWCKLHFHLLIWTDLEKLGGNPNSPCFALLPHRHGWLDFGAHVDTFPVTIQFVDLQV